MRPPYTITSKILQLVSSISEKVGAVNARFMDKPSPVLRKSNRIKTIHSSLSMEGNTLTEAQMTAILENKRVLGPSKDILEVQNAIALYQLFDSFDYRKEKDFLRAQRLLMKGLLDAAGSYRTANVGIVKGEELTHLPPAYTQIPALMRSLFEYLKKDEELLLIKSAVFHYEMEFIHPFTDGNGRMGRFWQHLILKQVNPVFEFLSIESTIGLLQDRYYQSLSICDKQGASTVFIEFMLEVIDDCLGKLFAENRGAWKSSERLAYFLESTPAISFTRSDYLTCFKDLSTASASRDLQAGVASGLLKKTGDKRKTIYQKA